MAKNEKTTKAAAPVAQSAQPASNAAQVIVQLRQVLASKFLERGELIECMMISLVSGEPLIMIGLPGTAKSAMSRDVCKAVQGKYFERMLTKFSKEEELFGPLSLKGLEQDRYCRVTTGKLPEADIGFIDEVGKASSAISNTLLAIMNERTFDNDGGPQPVPLLTLFGASNEIPQAEELGAFWDRFVIRYFVNPVKENASVRALFKGLPSASIPTLSREDVLALREASRQVAMPDAIVDTLVKIRRECEKQQILVSDRKWVQSVNLIRASAVLDGRNEVVEDDLMILMHVLWSDNVQIPAVRSLVAKLVNPVAEKITEVMDGLAGLNFDTTKEDERFEVYKKIAHAKETLAKLGDPTKMKKLADALAKVETIRVQVAKKVFKE